MSKLILNRDHIVQNLQQSVIECRKQMESMAKRHQIGMDALVSEHQLQLKNLQENLQMLRSTLDQTRVSYQLKKDELIQQEALRRAGLEEIIVGLRQRLDQEIAAQQLKDSKHQLDMDRLKESFKGTIQKLRDQLDNVYGTN